MTACFLMGVNRSISWWEVKAIFMIPSLPRIPRSTSTLLGSHIPIRDQGPTITSHRKRKKADGFEFFSEIRPRRLTRQPAPPAPPSCPSASHPTTSITSAVIIWREMGKRGEFLLRGAHGAVHELRFRPSVPEQAMVPLPSNASGDVPQMQWRHHHQMPSMSTSTSTIIRISPRPPFGP